jgi:8-amino-7-oxononanoate synthase
MSLDARLAQRLEALEGAALYRRRRVLDRSAEGARIDSRQIVAFCGNDYLGLANHPKVVEAFRRGADRYGVGSTGRTPRLRAHTRASRARGGARGFHRPAARAALLDRLHGESRRRRGARLQ